MLKQLLSYIPSKLPTTDTELKAWVSSVFELAGLPESDLILRHAVITYVMHLNETTTSVAKRSVVKRLHRGVIQQVAYKAIQALKEEEKLAATSKAEPDVVAVENEEAKEA